MGRRRGTDASRVEDVHRGLQSQLLHGGLGERGDAAAFRREQLSLGGDEVEVVRQPALVTSLCHLHLLAAQRHAGLGGVDGARQPLALTHLAAHVDGDLLDQGRASALAAVEFQRGLLMQMAARNGEAA